MQIIRGRQQIAAQHQGCVATIGNFDGVHLGHRALIDAAVLGARARQLPAVLVTFEPLTPEVLAAGGGPARLTRFAEKVLALGDSGIDRVLVLRFDRHLASLEADEFVREVLVDGIGVRALVVGDDFRFGRHGRGDFALLENAGRRHGFAVERIGTMSVDGQRVSSSAVRAALAAGDLTGAARLLGRPYAISGRVVHGERLGRQIGFPTANIPLRRARPALAGVFAVEVAGVAAGTIPGVANVGNRPTVGGRRGLLEAHLLEGEHDLYGRRIEVRFRARLREEQRFASIEELRAQIERDVSAACALFDIPRVRAAG